jgi:hypothetical protein
MCLDKRGDQGKSVFLALSVPLVILTCAACSPVYRYSYPGHDTFVSANLQTLQTGMCPKEVEHLLGTPDKVYDAEFGGAVGLSWTGTVWLYFLDEDDSFRHVRRYKKGTFVFYPRGENMRLNHWEIER